MGKGVGVLRGTQSQLLAGLRVHSPRRAGIFRHGASGGHGKEMMQSPPQVAPPHWGVGVTVGVGVLGGKQSQLSAPLGWHCPSCTKAGQASPGEHGKGKAHGPPQGAPLHWSTGVAVGVPCSPGVGVGKGTHAQPPSALCSHCPGSIAPGHGPSRQGAEMKHAPPHCAPPQHCPTVHSRCWRRPQ